MGDTEQKHRNRMDMLHGSLLDKILLFALPLAASSVLQQLFNSADIAVVGRFAENGSQAQAAVGANGSVITLLINLFVGMSIGANAVIANYIGQKQENRIHRAVHTVIVIALCSGVFLVLLGMVVARPVLTLMNTPDDVLEQAVLYLRLYFLGMPFIMFYNFGSAVLRSKGDTKRPLYSLIISGIINVLLNLLLVIVFRLGVSGVAISTVISNVFSAGMVLMFLLHEEEPFRLHLDKLSVSKEPLIRVLKIGVPAGIQGMLFSLSNVCIQSAVNGFGSDAVAGGTDAINFEYFTYFVINAFSQTAVTFTSQNYGAGECERCKKVFRLCMISCTIVTGIMCAVFIIWRNAFIRIYTVDEAAIEFALIRMMHVLTLEWLPNSYEISAAAMRGMGRSMLPAFITVLGTCAFRFLWVYTVFVKYNSFEMLMNVYPVSWVITGAAMLIAYFVVRKKAFAQFIGQS